MTQLSFEYYLYTRKLYSTMGKTRFDIILIPPLFMLSAGSMVAYYFFNSRLLFASVVALCIYTLVQTIRYFNNDHPPEKYLLSDKATFTKELRTLSPLVLSKDRTNFNDNSWYVFSIGLQYTFEFDGDKVAFQKVITKERALGFMPICWGVQTRMEKRVRQLLEENGALVI